MRDKKWEKSKIGYFNVTIYYNCHEIFTKVPENGCLRAGRKMQVSYVIIPVENRA